MNVRKKVSLVSIGLLVALGVTVAPSAATAAAACPINYVCLFSGPNGTGTRVGAENGTHLYNNPNYFFRANFISGTTVRSSINNTRVRSARIAPAIQRQTFSLHKPGATSPRRTSNGSRSADLRVWLSSAGTRPVEYSATNEPRIGRR